MRKLNRFFVSLIAFGAAAGLFQGCASAYKDSLGGDTDQLFTRVFVTDYNIAWQAVLEALKSARLDVSNRDSGFLQSRWTDNTAERNFVDSFGTAGAVVKAQYRLRLSVAKGVFGGKQAIKISVQKEQLIQRDVLEGWRPLATEGVEENTLLYRIGRLILIKMQLAEIEKRRTEEEMKKLDL